MDQAAMQVFMDYAAAFEQTYVDDDWSRLLPFFAEDATYHVVGGPMACEITGREAILKGLKKSIDGLDRRCDERVIDLIDGPHVNSTPGGHAIDIGWTASYRRGDSPMLVFPGRSVVTVEQGRIVALQDEYTDEDMRTLEPWMEKYGADLDGSYV